MIDAAAPAPTAVAAKPEANLDVLWEPPDADGFQRGMTVVPGYDKRAEGYGQHNAEAIFLLRGPLGAIVFEIHATHWDMPSVGHPCVGAAGLVEARYHASAEIEDRDRTEHCAWIGDVPCWSGGSYVAAAPAWRAVRTEGLPGLYRELRVLYDEWLAARRAGAVA